MAGSSRKAIIAALIGNGLIALTKFGAAALTGSLEVIACVGESLDEREADKTFDVIDAQMDAILGAFSADQAGSVTIAYEPVWAIGTGKVATPDQAEDVHAHIRKKIAAAHGQEVADAMRIQYGGSVKPGNAAEFFGQPDIDGALVGGASLKAADFVGIVKAAAES